MYGARSPGRGSRRSNSGSATPSTGSGAASSASSSPSSSASSKDIVENPPAKSWQDALDAAKDEFTGKVSKIELEPRMQGGLEYKIELKSPDKEFAVQYDAESLKKTSEKKDDLGDDAAKELKETFDPSSVIELEKAASTARKEQDGTITKWKLEGKDTGRVQYEFDILPAGASEDVEVQIDAKDGSVIK